MFLYKTAYCLGGNSRYFHAMNSVAMEVVESTAAKKGPVKVSIVEDNEKIRDGLVALVEMGDRFKCVSVHRTAEEACKQIPLKKPDVILMDINLPGMSGIECV